MDCPLFRLIDARFASFFVVGVVLVIIVVVAFLEYAGGEMNVGVSLQDRFVWSYCLPNPRIEIDVAIFLFFFSYGYFPFSLSR